MAVCYRHPDRETGVSCSNCGNPICPDCMTATPVGMRCPDCSKQRTPVRTMRNVYANPTVTYVLIAINVLMFIGSFRRRLVVRDRWRRRHGLPRPARCGARRSTSRTSTTGSSRRGFLHSGLLHIGFNMYILYWLGTMLEPALGHVRFTALYFASLLSGSFGALLLDPTAFTVGASGAVFGLMGAAFVLQRLRGVDPMAVGDRPGDPAQPRHHVPDPEHLDRRPHRRPDRRRGRGVRDGADRPAPPRDRAAGAGLRPGRRASPWRARSRSPAAATARSGSTGTRARSRPDPCGASASRSGCSTWPSSSRPSIRRGPGREKYAAASTATTRRAPSSASSSAYS